MSWLVSIALVFGNSHFLNAEGHVPASRTRGTVRWYPARGALAMRSSSFPGACFGGQTKRTCCKVL